MAEKGLVSDATSSPIALNVAVMAMMIEPIFAEQRLVSIVLSALSIQVTLAGQLGTIAQLINDQMINADLLYWMPFWFRRHESDNLNQIGFGYKTQ